MNKSEQPVDWKIQAGVNREVINKEMPYLLDYRGEVSVATLPNGNMVISGGMRSSSQDGQVVYRYNPETQTAQLLSLDTNRNIQGASTESLTEQVEFNHYLEPEQAFVMLATLMGVTVEQVKGMFPEATNYDQILLNQGYNKISISFNLPGQQSRFSCIYDYDLASGRLEHTYKNDGEGNVWAKWNDKRK